MFVHRNEPIQSVLDGQLTPMTSSTPTWSTSSLLIDEVKRNKPHAWERFVKIYTPLVYCWGRNKRLSPQDSHDLVQDMFRLVFQAIELYRPESFRGWLWTITQNQIRLYFPRKSGVEDAPGGSHAMLEMQQQEDHLLEESGSTDAETVEKSRTFLLNQALSIIRTDFQETTWKAFWMTVVDEMNSTEVSQQLKISPATVRNAKLRVLHRLREELGRL